jgi:hypothetical protein
MSGILIKKLIVHFVSTSRLNYIFMCREGVGSRTQMENNKEIGNLYSRYFLAQTREMKSNLRECIEITTEKIKKES